MVRGHQIHQSAEGNSQKNAVNDQEEQRCSVGECCTERIRGGDTLTVAMRESNPQGTRVQKDQLRSRRENAATNDVGNDEQGQTAGEASTERSWDGNVLVAMRESSQQGARVHKNQPQPRHQQRDSESESDNENAGAEK